MNNNYSRRNMLLHQRAQLYAKLKLLPYDGTPEVKEINEKKYLYVRKRIAGKISSVYVDIFSDELYSALLRYARDARELKKQIRIIEKELANIGYVEGSLSPSVIKNLDFARRNMKSNIYDQAVLEGVATTFPQTEDIINNGIVSGVRASDVQKILNLKHAWEFVLDKDVLSCESDYYVLSHIATLVNEGFYAAGGDIRIVPVNIGGTSYIPPIPMEADVKDKIKEIVNNDGAPIDIAISLCLYCMKTQIFNDGNKRTAVIFANHYLISKGQGLLIIPEEKVQEFRNLLVGYYEDKIIDGIYVFMKEHCWKKLD